MIESFYVFFLSFCAILSFQVHPSKVEPCISIHAPREGSDPWCQSLHDDADAHFYPRSPRGERQRIGVLPPHLLHISIHAPREGSDKGTSGYYQVMLDFYPRSPRGERLPCR